MNPKGAAAWSRWQRSLARDLGQCKDIRLLGICLLRSLMESPSVLGKVVSAAVSFAPLLGMDASRLRDVIPLPVLALDPDVAYLLKHGLCAVSGPSDPRLTITEEASIDTWLACSIAALYWEYGLGDVAYPMVNVGPPSEGQLACPRPLRSGNLVAARMALGLGDLVPYEPPACTLRERNAAGGGAVWPGWHRPSAEPRPSGSLTKLPSWRSFVGQPWLRTDWSPWRHIV